MGEGSSPGDACSIWLPTLTEESLFWGSVKSIPLVAWSGAWGSNVWFH